MRRSIVLALITAGCPGLPTETGTDPDTTVDTDTDTGTGIPPCPEDLLEDNDTPETAAPLDPAVPLQAQICADDPDWYAVPLTGRCTATIDLAFTHADGDLDLEVWDGDRRVAASSTTTDGESARFYVGDEDTAFQVLVEGFRGAENGYVLTTSLACPACVLDDDQEDNDTFDTATAATFPVTADACPDDADWYALPPTAVGCAIDATLSVVSGDPADVALDLADGGGVFTRGHRQGAGHALRSLVPDGAALVVEGTAATRYGLSLSSACPLPTPICPDDDGWDNGPDTLPVAIPAGTAADALACPGVPDRWLVQPSPCGADLTVTATEPVVVRVSTEAGPVSESEGVDHAWSAPGDDGAVFTVEVARADAAAADPAYTIAVTDRACPAP